ncbi:MAG: tetratricopeptide repeat protein [Bacteroidales bacterium]|nr:tetratricopeptide repeat protein [Bacteroidales bacterium]
MKKLLIILAITLNLSAILAQRPENEQLAIQYYQNGEFEKAAELFDDIYSKKTDSYIYYYYYQTLLNLNDFKKLEKIVKKQQKSQPNTQRYKIDLGYVYERSGDIEKATKEYENAIKTVEANESKIRELHNAFWSKGLRDYSINTLQHGRKILNNNKVFATDLANIYNQLQLTDKVIDEALALLKDDEAKYLQESEAIVQNLLADDADQYKYITLKNQLLRLTQKNPDNLCYLQMLFWIYQINKDYPASLQLAKAIDKRNKEEGERVYSLAKTAAANKDYETAIEALDYVISKGEDGANYDKAKYTLLDVRYLQLTTSYPIDKQKAKLLEADFKNVIDENGIHSGTAELTRKYAHLLAFYVDKPDEAVEILNNAISQATRDVKERSLYKIDLADILLYTGNVWDATLNYSQVEKSLPNDTIGQTAKFKNAKLSFYIGEFDWAKSQLDVLRAATSKLIANDAMYFSMIISDNEEEEEDDDFADETDTLLPLIFGEKDVNKPLKYFAKADFLMFQNKNEEALKMLDSVLYAEPSGKLTDDVYFQKSKIYARQQNFIEAEKMLQAILESHSDDILGDDAAFALGELYEYNFKDTQKAMEYYQRLMKDYPGSLYTVEARKRYRALRGDFDE